MLTESQARKDGGVNGDEPAEETADVTGETAPAADTNVHIPSNVLKDVTNTQLTYHKGNEVAADDKSKQSKARTTPPRKQRGPPEDGIPSKNKVMVANLPYDLNEDTVSSL